MKYEELISRHRFIISKKLQDKIKRCRVFLLGCGLGTQIGLLAVRMGFQNFILIDGDKVTADNLNRQAFRYEHIGENKAEALKSMIKNINSKANIEAYPMFLKDKRLARELINKSNVVVNMADPEEIMYFVNNYASKRGKPVFFPLNLIWGGYVLVFMPDSVKLEEIVGKKLKGNEFYFRLLENTFSTFPPSLLKFYEKRGQQLLNEPYFPQLGAAAYLNSSIIIEGIIKWLSGQPIKKAPQPIFLDLWEEI